MKSLDQNIIEEVKNARAGVALFMADDLGVMEVTGPDASKFLHNMLTADIKKLSVGEGTFTLKTSSRGMPESALHIYRGDDEVFLLLVSQEYLEPTYDALEKLHITEELELIKLHESNKLVALQGKSAGQLLKAAGLSDETKLSENYESRIIDFRDKKVVLLSQSLTGDPGFLLVAENDDAAPLYKVLEEAGKKLGCVALSQEAREAMRIEAGLPLYGRDILPNAVASELGIDHEVFSYDKGCFVGQEIIARIRTKGEVPFRLMGLSFSDSSSLPRAGEKLEDEEGKAGAAIVTSATVSPTLGRVVAMARVKRGYQTQGMKLVYQKDGNQHFAEVVELPFYLPGQEDQQSALYDEALTLFVQDKEEEALALLEEELKVRPDNVDAREALGVIHDRAGRHQEAIKEMRKVLDANSDHLMANVNLSLYYMKIGDKATAEDYQASATRISMERRMAEAKAQGKTLSGEDEASRVAKLEARIEKFKAIIEMDPTDVLGHFGAGKAYLDIKHYRNAAEHFEEVVKIQPDYSVAWANLGAAYAALGEKDKARTTFEKGIEIAGEKGDLMPKRDMEHRLSKLD